MQKGLILCVLMFFTTTAWSLSIDEIKKIKEEGSYFAIIDGAVISKEEFGDYLNAGMKQRFYHGTPPQAELLEYQKEMAESLIDEYLILREAERRGVEPDQSYVVGEIAKIDERYKNDEGWKKRREELLPEIKKNFERLSILTRFEALVRDVKEPSVAIVREYYSNNIGLFTTPEKDHVKMILLKVDPSSSSEVWRAAEDKASMIANDLRKGADFSEMAMIHSGDSSAADGGDMGFLHKGMLGGAAQQVLDLMAPGDVSEPVLLLDGVAIFLLYGRAEAKVNKFEAVKERATALLKRELSDNAWTTVLSDLKKGVEIEVNEALLSGS